MAEQGSAASPPASHALPVSEVLAQLAVTEAGLADEEVIRRRAEVGPNQLPQAQPRPWWRRLLAQFNNALLYVLLVAAGITFLLGYATDSVVILGVVVINALVGFIQEGKAEAALRGILAMVVSQALVRRSGRVLQIPVEELVPGDMVLVNAGDRLPADLRLVQARDLRCDESALTGESEPVEKQTEALPAHTMLAERSNCVYMGTRVTYGAGTGVVVATGVSTELGRIGELVSGVQVPVTPLTRQLEEFARWLSVSIVLATALAMLWGVYVAGLAWPDMFRAAVGIAVAAIPEGLPAVVTISLAIGVQRMARSRALVRKLPAVEVLGSVTTICTDKTGTLTRNEMTARSVVTAQASYDCDGEGYAPVGNVSRAGEVPGQLPEVLEHVAAVSLYCNDAEVAEENGQWVLHGDPTEGALHVLARKLGFPKVTQWRRLDLIPFSTESRYMAVLGHDHHGRAMIYLKGAPERVLQFCDRQWRESAAEALDRTFWHDSLAQLAGQGMRVMALAMKEHDANDATLSDDEVDGDMILLGLVGIEDPPRAEARDAIGQCRAAGIQVKMITGDNPRTAAAIGGQLGLDADRVMVGDDLDQLDDEQLREQVLKTAIYARTSPAHKLRLVEALQACGQVVSMTGDGVNDAPALKCANIGVAMGRKGTDAAREASAMVLTDDNFATIVKAVHEGRTVYDNIVKAILFVLPTSLVEASVLMIAILIGAQLPVTPVQILWVNMITAVTLAIALAFEPGEPDIMKRPPRRPGRGLVSGFVLRRILVVGAAGTAVVFWMFASHADSSVEEARTLAVTTLVLIETFYLFSCRRLYAPAWANRAWQGILPALLACSMVLLMQWAFTASTVMQALFDTVSLSLAGWGMACFWALSVVVVVELDKFLVASVRRYRKRHIPLRQAAS